MAQGTWMQCIFPGMYTDCTTTPVSVSRQTMTTNSTEFNQPIIPAGTIKRDTVIRIEAGGIIGADNTAGRTATLEVFFGTTAGSSFITIGAGTGVTVGITPAMVLLQNGASLWWRMELDLTCTVAGIGATATTLAGCGVCHGSTAFVSPFSYPVLPAQSSTYTCTIDRSLTQYVNLCAQFSSNAAGNTVQVKAGMFKAFIMN